MRIHARNFLTNGDELRNSAERSTSKRIAKMPSVRKRVCCVLTPLEAAIRARQSKLTLKKSGAQPPRVLELICGVFKSHGGCNLARGNATRRSRGLDLPELWRRA